MSTSSKTSARATRTAARLAAIAAIAAGAPSTVNPSLPTVAETAVDAPTNPTANGSPNPYNGKPLSPLALSTLAVIVAAPGYVDTHTSGLAIQSVQSLQIRGLISHRDDATKLTLNNLRRGATPSREFRATDLGLAYAAHVGLPVYVAPVAPDAPVASDAVDAPV